MKIDFDATYLMTPQPPFRMAPRLVRTRARDDADLHGGAESPVYSIAWGGTPPVPHVGVWWVEDGRRIGWTVSADWLSAT